ncbi:MAG: hypothetical protein U0931_30380 [Vulcanimicrobiota bacterium]
MFLRKMGHRYLLLHSYRDGRGKVCQRRLAHFESPAQMHVNLNRAEWRERLQTDYPEIKMDWRRLTQDAATLEQAPVAPRTRASQGRPSLAGQVRKLVRMAAEEGKVEVLHQAAEILQSRLRSLARPEAELARGESYLQSQQFAEAEAELEAVVWKTRLQLPPARRRLEEPQARDHLQALRSLSRALEGQGKTAESSRIAEQRARMNPARLSLGEYGLQLHKEGRWEEAAEQWRRVPWKFGWRHYNLAALAWSQGRQEESARHLLHGLVQDDDIACSLLRLYRRQTPGRSQYYWDGFGQLWDDQARGFLLAIYCDSLVRYELEQIRERGLGSRDLMRNWSLKRLLERAQNRLQGNDAHFKKTVPWRPPGDPAAAQLASHVADSQS